LVGADIAQVFADQVSVVAVMMIDEQLVAARDFVGTKRADGEVFEDVLFIGERVGDVGVVSVSLPAG
jgi:hypothetical protein